jgi:hypothetical protein
VFSEPIEYSQISAKFLRYPQNDDFHEDSGGRNPFNWGGGKQEAFKDWYSSP